jgi:hypothetical protein
MFYQVLKGCKKLRIKYKHPMLQIKPYVKAFGECIYMGIIVALGLLSLILFIKRKKLIKIFKELTQTEIEYSKLAKGISEISLESVLSINAAILYYLSYVTLWRRQSLLVKLKDQKPIKILVLLYLNLFGFVLDVIISPLALIPLLSGTRTVELIYKLKTEEGNHWWKRILHSFKDMVVDIGYLFPLVILVASLVNIPLLIRYLWGHSSLYPANKKMDLIRKGIRRYIIALVLFEIPLLCVGILAIPLCSVYIWRPYMWDVKLDYSKVRQKYRRLAYLHYRFIKNSKAIARDLMVLPCMLISLVWLWRLKTFVYVTRREFHRSKYYFKWAMERYLILLGDMLLMILMMLHIPFIARWKYARNIIIHELAIIKNNQLHYRYNEELVSIKHGVLSTAFCIVDILLLPVNTYMIVTVYRAKAIIRLYTPPDLEDYYE